jgi:DNA-binding NtrC family response regulator
MGARVLVVERVAALRRSFAQVLEDHGYATVSAATLAEALDVASSIPFDVAVIDERLIAAEGDALRALRSGDELGGPVVLVPCADVRRAPELVALGAHCTIRKPVIERELVSALGWALDVYRCDAA